CPVAQAPLLWSPIAFSESCSAWIRLSCFVDDETSPVATLNTDRSTVIYSPPSGISSLSTLYSANAPTSGDEPSPSSGGAEAELVTVADSASEAWWQRTSTGLSELPSHWLAPQTPLSQAPLSQGKPAL